jgi:hypothetical protein
MPREYEYKFVSVELKYNLSKVKNDYLKEIENNAKNGWRFIQMVVVPGAGTYGSSKSADLIFERELNNKCL